MSEIYEHTLKTWYEFVLTTSCLAIVLFIILFHYSFLLIFSSAKWFPECAVTFGSSLYPKQEYEEFIEIHSLVEQIRELETSKI